MSPSTSQPPTPTQPQRLRIGEGRISGYLSIFLSLLALGTVICLRFPELFTTPRFREVYQLANLRWLLVACLLLAFAFALTSALLSGRPRLALPGVLISAVAILFAGGVRPTAERSLDQTVFALSLDWLIIDILVLSAIFIPIELFFPQRPEQTKLHLEWKTDLVYFAISHLLVQVVAALVTAPAETLFGGWGLERLHETVTALPFLVQLALAMLLADLFQYAAHRAFHQVPLLWRFHAIHHSIRTVDWLAGSRLHLVDVVLTRAFSYLPLYVMGISMQVFYAYVVIVALQAVCAHANTRVPFGVLKFILVTPQYHHWHHSDDPRFYDKNFAIHFPFIDRLFGTFHLPGDEWPASMGLANENLPDGYLRQLVHPFRSSRGVERSTHDSPS